MLFLKGLEKQASSSLRRDILIVYHISPQHIKKSVATVSQTYDK
jgi:hypothetical protein